MVVKCTSISSLWPTVGKSDFSVTRGKERTDHWLDHQISTRRSGVFAVRRDMTFRSIRGLRQPPTRFVSRVLFTGDEVAKAGGWPYTTPNPEVKNTWN